jgi:hypothetical protein
MAVPGVSQVEALRFSRMDDPRKAQKPSLSALIAIHELEILRLDNDPADPERGSIQFKMKGGL